MQSNSISHKPPGVSRPKPFAPKPKPQVQQRGEAPNLAPPSSRGPKQVQTDPSKGQSAVPSPDQQKRLESDRVSLSREAQETTQGQDKAQKPQEGDKTQLLERIANLEKELAELRKEMEEKKDEPAKAEGGKGAGGAKGGGGPAKDKGPTEINKDAPVGFLWKPESDSDGNLAILLPPNMTGKVRGVEVTTPDGQVLASGAASGVGNGDREHFRFKKPGGSFPPGSIVKITMKDGSVQQIPIPNTGVRNEGGKKG